MPDQPNADSPKSDKEHPFDVAAGSPQTEAQDGLVRGPDGRFISPTAEAPSEAAPEQPATPPTPKHPAYLVEAATSLGFSEAEIDEYTTDQLNSVLWRIQRANERQRQELEARRPVEAPPQREAPPEEDDLGLDENYDPGIVAAMKKLHKQNKELAHQLNETRRDDDQRQQQITIDAIEDAFAALGPAGEKMFGKGRIEELREGGSEAKRRIATLRQCGISIESRESPGSIKRKIRDAFELFGEVSPYAAAAAPAPTPKPAGNGKRITPEQWDNAALARPTQRNQEEEPAGEAKATKNLAKKLGLEGVAKPQNELSEFFSKPEGT